MLVTQKLNYLKKIPDIIFRNPKKLVKQYKKFKKLKLKKKEKKKRFSSSALTDSGVAPYINYAPAINYVSHLTKPP